MQSELSQREFLGQGLNYPLQISQQGGLALARGVYDIEQAIHIILSTTPGERVMRPEFGCRIQELVFAPDNASSRRLAAYHVERALERWEPRIDVRTVEAIEDPEREGVLLIQIRYQIKDTYDERSIVYPFFLEGEEG